MIKRTWCFIWGHVWGRPYNAECQGRPVHVRICSRCGECEVVTVAR